MYISIDYQFPGGAFHKDVQFMTLERAVSFSETCIREGGYACIFISLGSSPKPVIDPNWIVSIHFN